MKRLMRDELAEMSEESLRTALSEIANLGAPAGQTNLWPRVRAQLIPHQAKPIRRRKLALTILAVVLTLAVSLGLLGPQRTFAALRGILGYIPGIGLVNTEGEIRVLETTPSASQESAEADTYILGNPVSSTHDGITVTVKQAVVDGEKTVVVLGGEGLSSEDYAPDSADAVCTELPRLSLPDGTILTARGSGTGRGWLTGFEMVYEFPPIPIDVDSANLQIPCIERTKTTTVPEGWVLPLQFMVAPPDLQPLPVVEMATAETTEGQARGYILEKVIDLGDRYVLAGRFEPNLDMAQPLISEYWPQIADADGNQIFYAVTDHLDNEVYEPGQFPWEFTIPKGFASPLTFTLDSLEVTRDGKTVRVAGPWTLTWTAPSDYRANDYKQEQTTCMLTPDRWLSALEETEAWPKDLTGGVVGYGFLNEDARASGVEESLFYVDLSEEAPKELGPGSWPALSPDGSQVAYTGSDGLYVLNLASGVKRKIQGTYEYDYHPRWSPDGNQIAFYRQLDGNIYIMNTDGSNPRMMTAYGEIELLVDWLPDGHRLAYGVPSANMQLRLLDVDSGEYQVSTVFNSWALDIGISPQGNTMAYVEGQATGAERVLMSDFERSEVNKVAQFDQRWILSYPVFSPDGNWLAISVTNRQSNKITPALINLRTCNTYAMKGVDGQLFDWSR